MKPKAKQTIRNTIARFLFGDTLVLSDKDRVIEKATKAALAAVTVKIDDSKGWDGHTPAPLDRSWAEFAEDLHDSRTAWQKSFLARRLVTLTRSYVVGAGLSISSESKQVQNFITAFWSDPDNQMGRRLGPMCDELTRAGELFPVLFTNMADGMSYVRFIPAAKIREVVCDEDDYEKETAYLMIRTKSAKPKEWIGVAHPSAFKPTETETGHEKLQPLMLHLCINKPIGASRGESDLTPVLPWIRRYTEWLKDRVRLNRQRTRQGVLDIALADDSLVEEKRQTLSREGGNPIEAGIYVHGQGEEVAMHSLKIEADEAKEDGRALRLAVAAGANIGLHYLGEGESINYATAKEMGEPTARYYSDRQADFIALLMDLVTVAYRRFCVVRGRQFPNDLKLVAHTTEVARADNQSLAQAARDICEALRDMIDLGITTREIAIDLAHQFAGRTLTADEITAILESPAELPEPETEEEEESE